MNEDEQNELIEDIEYLEDENAALRETLIQIAILIEEMLSIGLDDKLDS
jgi:hypothetical protein